MRRFLHFSIASLLLAGAFALTANAVRSSTGQPMPTETTVLTGTLIDGETIPLPQYADGTTAQESECRWMVSPHTQPALNDGQGMVCRTTGRVVLFERANSYGNEGWTVNYMIIATRQAPGATPASPWSWGSIKHAFAH